MSHGTPAGLRRARTRPLRSRGGASVPAGEPRPGPAILGRWLATGALALAIVGWQWCVTGAGSATVVAFASVFAVTVLLAGRAVVRGLRGALGSDIATELAVGVLVVAVLLLALQSLPIPAVIAAVAAPVLVGAGFLAARRVPMPSTASLPATSQLETSQVGAATIAVLASLVGATLWSGSSLTPFREIAGSPDSVVFRPWTDVLYHSTWIRMFAGADGIWSAGNNVWVGGHFEFYSIGDYLIPSAFMATTGATAVDVSNGLWMPLGLAWSGLAAFVLGRRFFGPAAGLGAAIAVLWLPDASTHALQNEYLDYYWLQVIAPGGSYGVASAALAVVFLSCWLQRGGVLALSLTGVAVGYTFLCKAQICLALLPLLVGLVIALQRRWHLGWRLGLLGLFALAIVAGPALAERFMPGLALRFDGSGAKPYLLTLAGEQRGWLPAANTGITADSSYLRDVLLGAPLLLLWTLGPAMPLAIGVLAWRRRRLAPSHGGLPTWTVGLAIAAYLGMALGLSVNATGKHTPDALVHRPFVWVWFVAAVFVGSGTARWLDSARPLRRPRAWIGAGAVLGALLVLFVFRSGSDGHRGPDWSTKFSERTVARDLLTCTRALRERTERDAVVQDASADPDLLVAAFSERRCYETTSGLIAAAMTDRAARRETLAALLRAGTRAEVARLAKATAIDYLLVRPGTELAWPAELLADPWLRVGEHVVHRLP